MVTVYKIPLSAGVSDQYISVELAGNPYRLRVTWNEVGGYWSLSIYTVADNPILLNIKMVKNWPLTDLFADDRLPSGELYFVQESGSTLRPGFDELAVTHNLFFAEPDASSALVPSTVEVIADDQIGSVWDSQLSTWDGGSTEWDM